MTVDSEPSYPGKRISQYAANIAYHCTSEYWIIRFAA